MRAISTQALACLSIFALSVGASAQAAPCTNATLIGAYGYQEEGEAPGSGFSKFRAIGEFTFDGKGHGTRVNTLWFSDFEVVPEPPSEITYSVSADCRFSLNYSVNTETFTGVITNGGIKLLYMETSGDPARSGQAERIRSDQ